MPDAPEGMISIEEFSKLKGVSQKKIISMVRDGLYIGRKVGEDWYVDESEASGGSNKRTNTKISIGSHENESVNEVVVTDIQMSFISMVIFMVKWVIASIPAFMILAVIFSVVTAIFGGALIGVTR